MRFVVIFHNQNFEVLDSVPSSDFPHNKTFPAVVAPVHSMNGVTHLSEKGLEWSEILRTRDLAKHRTGRSTSLEKAIAACCAPAVDFMDPVVSELLLPTVLHVP